MPEATAAILGALIRHYRKPGDGRNGEMLITEPSAPGSARRADLVRIGMWRSRGTGIDVHEIKVSRADWLRELRDPAKAEAWWPYCSRFWITAPPGLIAPAELPEGWGLMEPQARARRFRVVTQAASKTPELTVPLIIELLRRADNQRLGEIDALRDQHRDELRRAQEDALRQRAVAEVPRELRTRLDLLARLETALGCQLTAFGGWGRPVEDVTPEELAALLGDAGDHVAAQRRMSEAELLRGRLTRSVAGFLQQLERAEAPSA